MALLAVVANFAVQQTISVTTTRVRTVPPPAAEVTPAPPVAVQPLPEPADETIERRDPRRERDIQQLERASERFEHAVEARAAVRNADNTAAFDAASTQLRTVTKSAALANERRVLTGRINGFVTAGNDAVRVADLRRDAFEEYNAAIESINQRMKGSLDRAWKIMGRVIARQSLITTSQSFDEIRRQSTAFSTADAYGEQVVERMATAEAAFVETLKREESGLTRSQGAEWLAATRAEAARLVELRAAVVGLDTESRASARQLTSDGDALRKYLGTLPVQVAVTKPRRVTPGNGTGNSTDADQAVETLAPVVITAAPRSEVTTEVDPGDERARHRLAWLSAGVLVLLLALSTATVASIVRPVRRLIDATQRIAQGDPAVRVPRGGSKELDRLAMAFNQMAEQLAAAQAVARGYQQRLEANVVERTRQLQYQADHDSLTHLPNRRQLFSHLDNALRLAADRNEQVGLFFLDLDNFKNINDGLGHGYGDRVLQAIAERLRATVGSNGFASRFGGDEFTVIYSGMSSTEQMAQAGWSLVRAFQQPLQLDGRDLLVSISVGAGFFPDHAGDAESLLRAADAALFRAKALGRSQLTVFTPELLEAAASKFSTEQGLRHAVERGELLLVYQPEISLASLETTVIEALLRWRMPDGRHVSPADFLSIAEESGLIIEINDWVLRSAVAAAARWYHGGWSTVRVAINVSSRQLFDVQFADRVQALLEEHDLPARCLEIELTETVLQTGPTTIAGLRRLQELGVAIALDDFGTGYSSLASLEQLPLTRVKLDRSLIASIDVSARSVAIATAIIGLCRDLGMDITAEGVERPEQLAVLRETGVHIQGYLLSRAVPESEVLEVVALLPQKLQSVLLTAPSPQAAAKAPRDEPLLMSDTQRRRRLVLAGT